MYQSIETEQFVTGKAISALPWKAVYITFAVSRRELERSDMSACKTRPCVITRPQRSA